MSEDVQPEVIKKTQDILGKFIKKPILTDKLLKKPPFRFLYDICSSVMKETNFLEAILNSPEGKIENIKDKKGKIIFLQKVISAVEIATDVKLTVKPSKIVAGLEATETNEFLQALGKALIKQVEDKNAKSQASKVKATKKSSKEIKEEPSNQNKKSSSKSSKKVTENNINDVNDDHRNKKTIISPRKKTASKNSDDIILKEDKQLEKKSKENEISTIKSPEKKRKESVDNGSGEPAESNDIIFKKDSGGRDEEFQNLVEESSQNGEVRKNHSLKQKHRRSSIQNADQIIKILNESNDNNDNNEECNNDKKDVCPENLKNKEMNSVNKSASVLKEKNKETLTLTPQLTFTKKDEIPFKESTIISRPRTAVRPKTARPASSRPAAPRIRDRDEMTVMEVIPKPASGKVHIITENNANIEAEDDNLIYLETNNDLLLEENEPIQPPTTSTKEQGEHGYLVEQILETQKELEDERLLSSEEKVTGKTEIEWEFGKNKELTNRQIEKLRSNIQTLTRSVNPLGKLLDFFQEDIDTIQGELETWKEKNSRLSVQIANEKSVTDQFVEPLKIHLKEIQQSIEDQLEQISFVKANIIRNNKKIHTLLNEM